MCQLFHVSKKSNLSGDFNRAEVVNVFKKRATLNLAIFQLTLEVAVGI